ncbi:hypothetical protein HID58_026265 [Brassica napus]|uniref:Uncharacterized protein n=1 Tax=Brassica napus TaxID=3708 RepID=A0ABQ8CNE0_BRANA|nr:hypothetical protein HID58_026265 [Brassica napus]
MFITVKEMSKIEEMQTEATGLLRCQRMWRKHLFKWIEDVVCEEVEDVIPKLKIIDRENTTITEVDELKTLIED